MASLALAEFREWPVHPVRRIMGWLIRGQVREWSDHYYRHVVPKSLAVSYLIGLLILLLIASWVVALFWRSFG